MELDRSLLADRGRRTGNRRRQQPYSQAGDGRDLSFPRRISSAPLEPESILPVDFNYDFKMDLVLAGEGGVRFLRQENPASFTDVTAQTKLPPAVLNAGYTGAWAIDVEADGDMDILLGIHQGPPVVLRNNGDGSFTAIHPFAGISGVRGFAWADLDGDGNPDAAMIDGAGRAALLPQSKIGSISGACAACGIYPDESSDGCRCH